jgi:hypothetical protein
MECLVYKHNGMFFIDPLAINISLPMYSLIARFALGLMRPILRSDISANEVSLI